MPGLRICAGLIICYFVYFVSYLLCGWGCVYGVIVWFCEWCVVFSFLVDDLSVMHCYFLGWLLWFVWWMWWCLLGLLWVGVGLIV